MSSLLSKLEAALTCEGQPILYTAATTERQQQKFDGLITALRQHISWYIARQESWPCTSTQLRNKTNTRAADSSFCITLENWARHHQSLVRAALLLGCSVAQDTNYTVRLLVSPALTTS